MTELPKQLRDLIESINEIPKELADHSRIREQLIREAKAKDRGSQTELRKMIASGREVHSLLNSLEIALKNCAPILDKYDRQMQKDEAFLLELEKKEGKSNFNRDHPIYREQRAALAQLAQKALYPEDDFTNLLKELEAKTEYTSNVGELAKLFPILAKKADNISEHLRLIHDKAFSRV